MVTVARPDTATVQRRTLRVLFSTQVIGGVGVAVGLSVGALLAADMAGPGRSGLAQSAAVVGGALLAVPATRVMQRYGRRPGLAATYLTAAAGGVAVVTAAMTGSLTLLFAGLFVFGAGTTGNSLARYSAVDLAPPDRRSRHLSLIVWATTLGAVSGPNLAPLAGRLLEPAGVPTLAAPFAVSAGLFTLGALVLTALLRPDPLLVARRMREAATDGATDSGAQDGPPPRMRAALDALRTSASARLGVAAMAIGHLVMVSVMAMTPVHIHGAGHGDVDTLRIVGFVISVHIAGMYAFSPVTGWLADRYGRRSVIVGGILVLLLACAVAGTAGYHTGQLSAGLFLLGLGWSGTMVAGSTLLSESVPVTVRPSAQGLADLVMGLAGAGGGALSGLVLGAAGYPTLTLVAAVSAVPVLALALRPVQAGLGGPVRGRLDG